MIASSQTIQLRVTKDDSLANPGRVHLQWLGQAGFLISWDGIRILIDPYLSDSLAIKYAGQEFPHRRMMPVPVAPENLLGVTWCLCTHSHTDHMDPGTLPTVAAMNPECRFVVPRADAATALARGIPGDRMVGINAGETLALGPDAELGVTASAHEELEADAQGNFRYLGYLLKLGGIHIWHSGDCVPYPGLLQRVTEECVDLALLPVNGRDEFRRSRKVPGNFTMEEAVTLCREAGIPRMLAHHVGMFDFNTLSEEKLAAGALAAAPDVQVLLPDASIHYDLRKE